MSVRINRRALAAGLLATAAAPAAAKGTHQTRTLRGDDTERLPDHAALWSRMPLPFTPAQAWRLLAPETQAEIGAAAIGMALAEYVSGQLHEDEVDRFLDESLTSAAYDAQSEILNAFSPRLWALFPDLYGPEGDHPRWALDNGMVLPLGAVVPERVAAPVAVETDPVHAVLEAREAASRHLSRVSAETAGDESLEATARWTAGDRRLAAADEALRGTTPTTLAGVSALARHSAATASDPDSDGLTHLAEALADFLGDDPPLT